MGLMKRHSRPADRNQVCDRVGVVLEQRPAAGQHDQRVAIGGQTTNAWRNQVAGIARVAVATPGAGGSLIAMLTRGHNIPVKSDGNGGVGQLAVANSGSAADVTATAVGTGPSYLVVGTMRAAASGGNINVDVDVPSLP